MKIHDEIEDWMAGALCDALTPDEQKNFEQHLAQCPHCRSLYEENQKMNDLLNQTLPELRPDQNFERRVIAAFREKIARGSFHPWSGLVWFVQFRTVRAALALLLIAAMVKGGSMISGERFAGGKAYNARDYARMQTHTRALADSALNLVIGEIRGASTGGNGVFNGSTSDTRMLSGTLTDGGGNLSVSGNNVTIAALSQKGGIFATGANMGDSTIDAGVALGGNQTWTLNNSAATPLTVNGALSGGHAVAGAGNITFGGGALQYTAGNMTGNGASFPVAAKDTGAVSIDTNGQSVNYAVMAPKGGGGSIDNTISILKAGTGTGKLALSGSNTYTGKTTITGGELVLGGNNTGFIAGAVSGGHGLTVNNGGGSLALTDANIYSGATTLTSGVLALNNKDSLGSVVNGITVNGGAGTGTTSGSASLNVMANRVVLSSTSSFGTVHAGAVVSGTTVLSSTGVDNGYTRATVADGYREKAEAEAARSIVTKYVVAANEPHPGAAKPGAQTPAATQPAPAPLVDSRKLIRNAALDFEVLSFEKALDTITGVAGEEQGYVFSQNSAKGPNGKLQGQIIVKVLPPNLDRFLLKLRLLGDMKNQTVSAQDVSKDYYDTEARIRNSQVTEARLIDMMKTRTGKVSDLLEVENEITRVRGEIEQMQGTLQVYDAQVQYATVTITLQEKDINQTAAYLLQEHAQLSLFAKDVEKAFTEAKSDAADAKSQTLESHLERDGAGHVVATLHLLIPPDASEVAIDKLKAIGRIDHFNAQTERVARDGNAYSDTAKVDRDKVELNLVIQQDAENAVQGTNISVLTDKVEDKTAQIKEAAAKEGIEVKGAEFNRAQNGVEVSGMLLRMPVSKYAKFLEQIKSLGKVKDFTVARREDATATDDAPAEIALQIYSQGSIVAEDTGLWVTVRGTLGEGMAALMWSLRMIGVSLAFIAPWAIGLGLVAWLVAHRRRAAQKQG